MKRLAAFIVAFAFMAGAANAQGLNRLCYTTDGNNCVPATQSNPYPVTLGAQATGGCTPSYFITAATTNSTSIKASAGTLCSITATTTATTANWLKVYDTASAPTCKTDTVVQSFAITGSTSGQSLYQLPAYGLAFTNGIGVCVTGAYPATDDTAATAGASISYGFK